MHTSMVSNNAGQLSWGTTREAIINIAIAAPIFIISHNMNLAAADTADEARRVIPRASNALGTTVANAP